EIRQQRRGWRADETSFSVAEILVAVFRTAREQGQERGRRAILQVAERFEDLIGTREASNTLYQLRQPAGVRIRDDRSAQVVHVRGVIEQGDADVFDGHEAEELAKRVRFGQSLLLEFFLREEPPAGKRRRPFE